MSTVPNVVMDRTMPEGSRDRLNKVLHARLEEARRNPLKYGHGLHAMQERFICDSARHKIVVAANRVGKTEGKMKDVLWRARGNHPYRRLKPHSVIWVGAPDFPSYERYHLPAFHAWCPPSWIVGSPPSPHKRTVNIRREDGGLCAIHFLSYDMPRTKWQGAGVDHIWLDETPPEEIVGECLARIVTTRGSIDLTFTPVDGIGWWYDRLWLPARRGASKWRGFTMPLATYDPDNDLEYNVGRTLVPHLSRQQIVDFASNYPDPDDRAIRVFGEVKGRKGLVYKQYRRDIHRIPAFELPGHYELWGGLDPGYHGFAWGLMAISPHNRLYICKEGFSQQQTTAERFGQMVEHVREVRGPHYSPDEPETVVFFVDTEDPQTVLELNTASAEFTKEQAGREAEDEQGKLQVRLVFASLEQGLKARKAGFLRVQQTLQPKESLPTPGVVQRPRPENGEPQVYFFDDLYAEWQAEDDYHRESRVLWEIERYSWKKPTQANPVQSDDADEASADGAHAMAWLRYLIMARLGPPDQPEADKREHLPQHVREIWEEFEELEQQQLAQAGLLG